MTHLILMFLANFVFIFLKAFQQRNIGGAHYAAIIPTSGMLALTEVYIIAQIAMRGFELPVVLALGLAGGLGSLAAVWAHLRLFPALEDKHVSA